MNRQKYEVSTEVKLARQKAFMQDHSVIFEYVLDNIHPYAADETQQKGYDECLTKFVEMFASLKADYIDLVNDLVKRVKSN